MRWIKTKNDEQDELRNEHESELCDHEERTIELESEVDERKERIIESNEDIQSNDIDAARLKLNRTLDKQLRDQNKADFKRY
jgi:ribosomal protein L16/L10AE